MNERIQELAEQAEDDVVADHRGDEFHKAYTQRFAELIVKECAEIADLADENKCEWIGGNILTHFGVK